MGQVKVMIKVSNLVKPGPVIESEAIVDTGCTLLALPRAMIDELQLTYNRTVEARTTNGMAQRRIYKGAEVTIKDRSATVDVLELGDDLPPLVGVVPLDVMDFVVYPDKLDVFANPAHGGEYMVDLL